MMNTDKPLATLTNKQTPRKMTKMNKIRTEIGDITTDNTELLNYKKLL